MAPICLVSIATVWGVLDQSVYWVNMDVGSDALLSVRALISALENLHFCIDYFHCIGYYIPRGDPLLPAWAV